MTTNASESRSATGRIAMDCVETLSRHEDLALKSRFAGKTVALNSCSVITVSTYDRVKFSFHRGSERVGISVCHDGDRVRISFHRGNDCLEVFVPSQLYLRMIALCFRSITSAAALISCLVPLRRRSRYNLVLP